ncbi:unnamed protein product, partial [Candidula unifasciata]
YLTTMAEEISSKAYSLADQTLTEQLLELLQQTLNRGQAEFIVLTADAEPVEILLHLPLLKV